MKQAQREMGEDAMLVNSRETLAESRHLGAWEVVFGSAMEDMGAKLVEEAASGGNGGGLDINRHLEEIQTLLKRVAGLAASPQAAPAPNSNLGVGQALVDSGLDPTLAMEIEESVNLKVGKTTRANAQAIMLETAREISGRFAVQPKIGNITALVGPPGCGKTTTLVKLSVTQGLQARRQVRLISADTHRIGGADQLRRYAEILDVPFEAVETAAELARVIDGAAANSLTLIDTPGFSQVGLSGAAGELAQFLASRQDIDTHLVLTASMRSQDLNRTAERFEIFSPAKLLFTKLDETDSFAALFREAVMRQRPLSFFCDGVSVPEHIQPASKERIITSLVRHLPNDLRRAA